MLARGAGLDYIPRVLTIKKLTKTLGGRTLLREAEMSINWGERVALVGPNGAGKSTLFRMILDEDSPDEGTIERDEYAITGYLPQEAGEPTDETIIEIAMGITPEMIGILRTIREHEAKGDLSHLDFAKAHIDRKPDFSEEVMNDWESEGIENFGDRWSDVKAVVYELRKFGIYYYDAKPGNINFGDAP